MNCLQSWHNLLPPLIKSLWSTFLVATIPYGLELVVPFLQCSEFISAASDGSSVSIFKTARKPKSEIEINRVKNLEALPLIEKGKTSLKRHIFKETEEKSKELTNKAAKEDKCHCSWDKPHSNQTLSVDQIKSTTNRALRTTGSQVSPGQGVGSLPWTVAQSAAF